VAATTHDTEGINVMTYNRCIGTRYCSNNCPYKVRRFNYFDWHSKTETDFQSRFPLPWPGMPDTQQVESIDPIRQMGFNPDVTVRMRGVMEKCTYCVQRIAGAKIKAKNAHLAGERQSELLADGEVLTACQQACPTQAITFGNLNDRAAAVTALHMNPRAYGVLEELNTRPRGKHLAKVRNPSASVASEHPATAPAEAKESHTA
jgi:molybdopterin-containing oxidoreductase family iron-sulfur binding subunit